MTILKNFDEFIIEELNNPEFASDYLQDDLEEGGIPLFLIALRQIVQHQKELITVAKETGLGRESSWLQLNIKCRIAILPVHRLEACSTI